MVSALQVGSLPLAELHPEESRFLEESLLREDRVEELPAHRPARLFLVLQRRQDSRAEWLQAVRRQETPHQATTLVRIHLAVPPVASGGHSTHSEPTPKRSSSALSDSLGRNS